MYGSRAVSSFAQGFNFIDQAIDRRNQRIERKEEREAIKNYRNEQLGISKKQLEIQEKNANRQAEYQDKQLELAEKRTNAQVEANKQAAELRRQELERLKKEEARQQAVRELASIDYKVKNGVPFTDEDKKLLDKHTPGWKDAYKPETITAAKTIISSLPNLKSFREINQRPEVLQSLNALYRQQLQRGVGETVTLPDVKAPDGSLLKKGKKVKIIDKSIAQIVPGRAPGTVAVGLNVTYVDENGETGTYTAPMTMGRSGDSKDDKVKQIPVDDWLRDLSARTQLIVQLNRGRMRKSLGSKLIALNGVPKPDGNPASDYMRAFGMAQQANQNALLYGQLSGNDDYEEISAEDILKQAQIYARQQQSY